MKIRGRRLVLIAAVVTLALGVLAALGAGWILKTVSGRDIVRARAERMISARLHGARVHLGAISGALFSAPRIDSVEIRDADDSVLVATGPITFEFDLVDLWDGRIALRNVIVRRPFVHLRRDTAGVWNYRTLLGPGGPPKPASAARKLGELVVLDSVTLRDGEFRWTEPWKPAPWLRGAGRDSAVAFNLARADADVRRVRAGLVKVREWRALQLVVPHARVKHPDSAGVAVVFTRLDVDESDPPFTVRGGRGDVLVVHDTVHLDVAAFRLPGSSGNARGTLLTKNGLTARVRVVADTVSLADIAWLYPTLPKEGGGRMTLDIRKDSTSDHLGFAITKMDVQTTRSRVTGAMTFGVGEPLLAITDVDLGLAPVDFKLIEQFNGGPLSLPWAGQLRGRVRGRGGPLDHFVVDDAAIEFTDGNVAGVVNRLRGSGELDIVRPIETAFHDFAVDIEHFDLRTAQAVNDSFPLWKGWIFGTARLDSIWTDVRFRDADLRYAADGSLISHFTGAGRITVGDVAMIYDLALVADPILLEALALSYPEFPMRGAFRGPFTMRGTLGDLAVTGDLAGDGGRVRTNNLHLDALEPRYRADGRLELMGIDPSRVLAKAPRWPGDVTATVDAAVSGDSIATLAGGLRIAVSRSSLRGVRVQRGNAGLTFGEGLVRVDSVTLFSDAFTLAGGGALGLRAGRSDSLHLTAQMDSLGGLRAFIAPPSDSLAALVLEGAVTATAHIAGSVDSLDLRLGLRGTGLAYGASSARALTLDADVRDLTGQRVGPIAFTADSATLFGVRFARAHGAAQLTGGDRARTSLHMESATGPVIDGAAGVAWDSLTVRTVLDSLQLVVGDHRWRLARPAALVSSNGAVTIDTIELRGGDQARLMLAASLPDAGEVRGTLNADVFPLGDLGQLLQVPIPLSGAAALWVTLTGTRDLPQIAFEMRALDARLGGTRVEGLHATGDYDNQALRARVEYSRKGVTVLHGDATLPMDLSLRTVANRLLARPLRGSLVADSTDLAVVEAFSGAVTRATGRLDVNLALSGTWDKPLVVGQLAIAKGAMSFARLGDRIRYDEITTKIRFLGDSIQIDTLSVHSGGDPLARAHLLGNLSFANWDDPWFSLVLKAEHFHAIANRDIADLEITTNPATALRLTGRRSGSDLVGGATINGAVYVPESYKKRIIALDDDYLSTIDTSVFANRRLLPPAPSMLADNLRVTDVVVAAGDNLWLRSEEANIRLGGALNVTVGTSSRAGIRGRRLPTLEGTLFAQQGTYRLSYGLIQRTFTVENGGTVKFFGDPDVSEEININALYTVRQFDQRDARQDVRIRATLGGSLSQLTVSLSSPDSLRISGADLISYLVTGAPSLQIGGRNSDYTYAAARIAVTSLGSWVGSRLSGGAFGLELSTAGLESGYGGGVKKVGSGILSGTRVGLSWQLKNNLYLRVDTGLCQLGQVLGNSQSSLDPTAFANSVGLKLAGLFATDFGWSAGVDPATNALLCAQGSSARGFAPTPRALGLDVFRAWRF